MPVDVARVDVRASLELGRIGCGKGEDAQELGFERAGRQFAEELAASWITRPA